MSQDLSILISNKSRQKDKNKITINKKITRIYQKERAGDISY